MKETTEEALQRLFDFGHELPDVECKLGGNIEEPEAHGGALRAIMAMTNTPGGGWVVLGVRDTEQGLVVTEMNTHAATWKHDRLGELVERYAIPEIEFYIRTAKRGDQTLLVVRVEEFRDTPVFCKRLLPRPVPPGQDGTKVKNREKNPILAENAIYVRGLNPIKTINAATSLSAMRNLLDFATRKRVIAFAETAAAAGVPLRTQRNIFDEQKEAFLNG